MNCWPSGKYVQLLYMYSIFGRGSFALMEAMLIFENHQNKHTPTQKGLAPILIAPPHIYEAYAQSRSSLFAEYASCVGPPKHQGALLISKRFSFSFINAVRCHPLYVKSRSNHVTWMSYSLLHETKKKTSEEILFLECFPWARFEMEWNADNCVSSILSSNTNFWLI